MPTLRQILIISFLILSPALSVAASINLNVSATVLSKNQCRFQTANATLDFGNLDSGSTTPVAATTTMQFICRGSEPTATFLITQDDGLNSTGPLSPRMQHDTLPGNFIPYTLSFSPSTMSIPRNAAQTLSITGNLAAGSYLAAPSGIYSDTVIFTIAP